MANTIADAYVQIMPSTDGMKKNLTEALKGDADSAGESAGKSIGAKIKSAIVAAGIGAAVIGTIKSAFSEGAALEQSFGGLETIYGEAADAAKNYAAEAAKAGISANDYAEQAVSFGASLKQAFSGDTTKAVEAANTAIMDMADNAAKMGTPLEAIQNAYQGFAKQNYTMLDNLKLGYGGTKTEMERLLADAQKISGVEYDISNLGDVYDAIHVIQGELGLTGVAAYEAAETLSGSFGAVKAAWANTLAAITTGGDVQSAIQGLITSAGNLLSNALPALGNIITGLLTGIGTFLSDGLPQILQQIIDWMVSSLPMIAEAGVTLFVALVSAMPDIISKISDALPELIIGITSALIGHIPELIQAGVELISAIVEDLPTIIVNITAVIPQLISSLSEAILSNLPVIIRAGFDLMLGLAKGILQAIPQLIANALAACKQLLNSVLSFFGIHSPSRVFEGIGDNLMLGLAGGIEDGRNAVADAIDDVTKATTGELESKLAMNVRASAAAVDSPGGENASVDVLKALENMKVFIYGDKLVGYIASDMDKALGLRVGAAARGYA